LSLSTASGEERSSSPLGRRDCGASRFWWRSSSRGGGLARFIAERPVHGALGPARKERGGGSPLGELGGGIRGQRWCQTLDTCPRWSAVRGREDNTVFGRQQSARQKEGTGRHRWEAEGGPGIRSVLVLEVLACFTCPRRKVRVYRGGEER
jgi:hypothetical protein